MQMPWEIIKKGNKWLVVKKSDGKVVGTHDSKEKAKKQLAALHANVKEDEIKDVDVTFPVTFEIKETDPNNRWVNIGGVALTPVQSRNGITYTTKNIAENDGVKAKFFMTHELTPKNVVGHVSFRKEGDALVYDAKIRNTKTYPDVIEMAKDRFFEVSIDGRYKRIKRVAVGEGEGKAYQYQLEGLEIRGLCAVGVGGIPTNSVDYAIAEEFKKLDDKNVEEIEINEQEVNNMAEEEKLKQLMKEKEELQKEVEALKAKEKAREEEHRKSVVEKLVNLGQKEADLKDKSIKELEIMLSYEEKLAKEQEDESEEEGNAEVEETEENKKEDASGIVIEKEGNITFSPKAYKEFNKEIRESIPR